MGIKEIISAMREGKIEKNKKFHELEEDFLLRKKLEERQKSANERELERYMKEQREDSIKKQLETFRKRKQDELWHNNFLLKKDKSILRTDRPILKEKNIFVMEKQNNERSLFFK
jgi:hypothetical protein